MTAGFCAKQYKMLTKKLIRSDWITIGLAKCCDFKNRLYRTWCKTHTSTNWNTYINYKRKLDKLLAKAKVDYYHKEFSNCQSDLKKGVANYK